MKGRRLLGTAFGKDKSEEKKARLKEKYWGKAKARVDELALSRHLTLPEKARFFAEVAGKAERDRGNWWAKESKLVDDVVAGHSFTKGWLAGWLMKHPDLGPVLTGLGTFILTGTASLGIIGSLADALLAKSHALFNFVFYPLVTVPSILAFGAGERVCRYITRARKEAIAAFGKELEGGRG